MHPVIKTTAYTFAAFLMLTVLAFLNRGKIDHHYQMAQHYYQEVPK